MKAAIYKGIKHITIEERPELSCGDNDVIVKNIYGGICGSDKAAYFFGGEAVLIGVDSEFGHEAVSEVLAIGEKVKEFKVGDRVYPDPATCKGDLLRASTIGAFSENIQVLNAEEGVSLHKVPDTVSSKAAVLIEPLNVGFYTAKRAQAKLGDTAVIFGPGIIGVGAAFGLRERGVENILVAGTSDFRLDLLKQYGFETCNIRNEDVSDKLNEVFGVKQDNFGLKADVDIWVDAAGAGSIVEAFTELGKHGSRLVVAGIHHEPRAINLQKLTLNDQVIIGSAGYDDVSAVMRFLENTQYNIEALVTHEFTLQDIEEAIVLSSQSDKTLKVLIKH